MEAPSRRPLLRFFLPIAILVVAAVLLFARTMDRDLNHDEHQFLAPGFVVAHQGVQPYRDFPLFHMPNLVFVYAAVSRLTDHYIFGAKLVSFAGSLTVLGAIIFRGVRRLPFGSSKWIVPIALALPVLLLFDPLFLATAGKTWNHELPVGALALAFVALLSSFDRRSLLLSAGAGALVSFAVGTRLTFLPLIVPFVMAFGLFPGIDVRRRWLLLAAFAIGALVAAAPSFYYFFTSHDAFLFGNLEFPRVRLLDPTDTRAIETMTWWRKVRYFFKEVVFLDRQKDGQIHGSLLLFLAFVSIAIAPAWQWLRRRFSQSSESAGDGFGLAFATLIVPFVIFGCGLPTRYQYQHWFAVVPFLALALVEALPYATAGRWQWRPAALTGLALASLVLSASAYAEPLARLTKPAEWFSSRMHEYAKPMSTYVTRGKVLTLSPAWATEARLPIYPEFATAPFPWRLGHLVDPEKRRRFHLIAPADLADFLADDPPAAILTGVEEEDLERPLIDYAKAHGFQLVRLAKKRELWIPPAQAGTSAR